MSALWKVIRYSLFEKSKVSQRRTTNQLGFTLIELMVAISIVAILSTIGMVMFSSAQGTARDAKRKGDLEDIKKALFEYKAATGSFCPLNTASGCSWAAAVNDTTPSGGNGWGFEGTNANSLKNTILTYFKQALHDPKCPAGTCSGWSDYYLSITYETFVLSAQLENGAFTTCINSSKAPAAGRNYCITE